LGSYLACVVFDIIPSFINKKVPDQVFRLLAVFVNLIGLLVLTHTLMTLADLAIDQ
jgi:hypothetical protein